MQNYITEIKRYFVLNRKLYNNKNLLDGKKLNYKFIEPYLLSEDSFKSYIFQIPLSIFSDIESQLDLMEQFFYSNLIYHLSNHRDVDDFQFRIKRLKDRLAYFQQELFDFVEKLSEAISPSEDHLNRLTDRVIIAKDRLTQLENVFYETKSETFNRQYLEDSNSVKTLKGKNKLLSRMLYAISNDLLDIGLTDKQNSFLHLDIEHLKFCNFLKQKAQEISQFRDKNKIAKEIQFVLNEFDLYSTSEAFRNSANHQVSLPKVKEYMRTLRFFVRLYLEKFNGGVKNSIRNLKKKSEDLGRIPRREMVYSNVNHLSDFYKYYFGWHIDFRSIDAEILFDSKLTREIPFRLDILKKEYASELSTLGIGSVNIKASNNLSEEDEKLIDKIILEINIVQRFANKDGNVGDGLKTINSILADLETVIENLKEYELKNDGSFEENKKAFITYHYKKRQIEYLENIVLRVEALSKLYVTGLKEAIIQSDFKFGLQVVFLALLNLQMKYSEFTEGVTVLTLGNVSLSEKFDVIQYFSTDVEKVNDFLLEFEQLLPHIYNDPSLMSPFFQHIAREKIHFENKISSFMEKIDDVVDDALLNEIFIYRLRKYLVVFDLFEEMHAVLKSRLTVRSASRFPFLKEYLFTQIRPLNEFFKTIEVISFTNLQSLSTERLNLGDQKLLRDLVNRLKQSIILFTYDPFIQKQDLLEVENILYWMKKLVVELQEKEVNVRLIYLSWYMIQGAVKNLGDISSHPIVEFIPINLLERLLNVLSDKVDIGSINEQQSIIRAEWVRKLIEFEHMLLYSYSSSDLLVPQKEILTKISEQFSSIIRDPHDSMKIYKLKKYIKTVAQKRFEDSNQSKEDEVYADVASIFQQSSRAQIYFGSLLEFLNFIEISEVKKFDELDIKKGTYMIQELLKFYVNVWKNKTKELFSSEDMSEEVILKISEKMNLLLNSIHSGISIDIVGARNVASILEEIIFLSKNTSIDSTGYVNFSEFTKQLKGVFDEYIDFDGDLIWENALYLSTDLLASLEAQQYIQNYEEFLTQINEEWMNHSHIARDLELSIVKKNIQEVEISLSKNKKNELLKIVIKTFRRYSNQRGAGAYQITRLIQKSRMLLENFGKTKLRQISRELFIKTMLQFNKRLTHSHDFQNLTSIIFEVENLVNRGKISDYEKWINLKEDLLGGDPIVLLLYQEVSSVIGISYKEIIPLKSA